MKPIICPLTVPVSKRKTFSLNLNRYRNEHYQVLNKAKIAYFAEIRYQAARIPVFERVGVKMVLYPKTKHLCDIDNVLSIHCKFFLDALVRLGKIEDDNYLFVPEISFCFGRVDKVKPRVEITLHDLGKQVT